MKEKRGTAWDHQRGGLLPDTRREAADRQPSTHRVVLRADGAELSGWVLNESSGGIRIILEEQVEVGQTFDIVIGTEPDGGVPSRAASCGRRQRRMG